MNHDTNTHPESVIEPDLSERGCTEKPSIDDVVCTCRAAGKPTFHYRGPVDELAGRPSKAVALRKMLTDSVLHAIAAAPSGGFVHIDVRAVEPEPPEVAA